MFDGVTPGKAMFSSKKTTTTTKDLEHCQLLMKHGNHNRVVILLRLTEGETRPQTPQILTLFETLNEKYPRILHIT